MKKIAFLIFLWLLLTSCTQNNIEDNEKEIKAWDNLPACSDMPEWYEWQCEKSIDESINIINPKENMKTSYQTEAPKSWDIIAIMKTTNGTIKIKLFPEDVPSVVNNFIWLANEGYYDWIIFHRVINNFMIQWGDPDGTWMWGRSIYWEKFDDEFSDKLTNMTGSISMANAWADTNWSQFFINQKDNSNLDFDKQPLTSKHSVFWQVYEGMENVNKIAKTKADQNDKPEKDVKIISLEIFKLDWTKEVAYKINQDEIVKEYSDKKSNLNEAKKTKAIVAWDNVAINYTWKLEDWTVFDSSLNPWRTPIEFEVWAKEMIKGFDDWVIGMKIWEKKTLTLAPADAYWEYDETRTQDLKREELKSFEDAWIELVVWSELPTQQWKFKIIKVEGDVITIDLNHELAWKTLIFDIEVVEIK